MDVFGGSGIITLNTAVPKGCLQTYNDLNRDLMTPDEIRMLPTNDALLFIRGEKPVRDKEYNIRRHPNVRRTTTAAGSVCAGALLLCCVVPAYATGGLLIAFAKEILTLIGAV